MKAEEKQAQLNWYLQAFEQVRAKVGDDSVAAAIVEQVGKDVRTQLMNDSRSSGSVVRSSELTPRGEKRVVNVDAPASEPQLTLLRKLGVKHIDPETNRGAASQLISELKAQRASK